MPGRFIKFLEQYAQYVQLPGNAADKQKYETAKLHIKPGEFSRLFNSFPLSYVMNDETYSAVDPELAAEWLARLIAILNQYEFGLSTENDKPELLASPKAHQAVHVLMEAMLKQIISDVLLDHDQLDPEIFTAMGLVESDYNAVRSDPVKSQMMLSQIIISYLSQILMPNLVSLDNKEFIMRVKVDKLESRYLFVSLLDQHAQQALSAFFISNALKKEHWSLVVHVLLHEKHLPALNKHDNALIQHNRHRLCLAFIEALKASKDRIDLSERMGKLDEVIRGETALGLILTQPTSKAGLLFSGKKVTDSISALMRYRDKLNEDLEEKRGPGLGNN